jgi:chromosome segregation ATPase
MLQVLKVAARWEDGTETIHNLQRNPGPNRPETIKYIPQTYLETVCTETSVDEASTFQHELRKVIFSHITDVQRLGRETLEDLIAYKTEEIDAELNRHKQALTQANATIAALQQRATPDFRRQVEETVSEKKKELTEEQKEAYDKVGADLTAENAKLQTLEQQIAAGRQRLKTLTEQTALVGKLEAKLANIETDLKAQIQQSEPQFTSLGLDVAQIITFAINREPPLGKKATIAAEKAQVEATLSANDPASLLTQLKAVQDRITGLKN